MYPALFLQFCHATFEDCFGFFQPFFSEIRNKKNNIKSELFRTSGLSTVFSAQWTFPSDRDCLGCPLFYTDVFKILKSRSKVYLQKKAYLTLHQPKMFCFAILTLYVVDYETKIKDREGGNQSENEF